MKKRNGKVIEYEREEAGGFYRFSAAEIAEACRAWEKRRGLRQKERRNEFLFRKKRSRRADCAKA